MSFHHERISVDVEQGAVGGPRFRTDILELRSGLEQRNALWSQERGEWDISYGMMNKDGYMDVANFFRARRGRGFGFRFRDWTDFEAENAPMTLIPGETGKYQLQKKYGSYLRDITKPAFGSVSVTESGTTRVFTGSYPGNMMPSVGGRTLDFATGIYTGGAATWTGEFDVPVRFADDELDLSIVYYNAGSVPRIVLLELKE